MTALAFAAVALAKAPKPKPAPEPAPAPAPRLPAVPSPAEPGWTADHVPSVVGATEVITGQNLSRDTATMVFEFDLSGLDRLDAAGVDALFTLLAADPGWRVVVRPAGRVATRRHETAGLDGWHVRAGRCERLALVEAREPAFTGARVAVASATAGTVKVAAFRPHDGPVACREWATMFVLDGARLDLELYEAGAVDDRSWTLEALQELPRPIAWARLDAAAIVATGHREAPGSAGETRYEAGPVPGSWTAERWVNPGAPGRVWLRLLDATGNALAEASVGAQSLQLVGWSTEPAHAFLVGGVVALPPGPAFSGTAEWWFQATDGAVRRLASDAVLVPAR